MRKGRNIIISAILAVGASGSMLASVAVLAATPRAVRERGDAPRPAFADLLDAFTALRTANLALIRDTPEALWARLGIHAERGPISFRLMTETMAGHDCAHLRQLQQTIVAVQAQPDRDGSHDLDVQTGGGASATSAW